MPVNKPIQISVVDEEPDEGEDIKPNKAAVKRKKSTTKKKSRTKPKRERRPKPEPIQLSVASPQGEIPKKVDAAGKSDVTDLKMKAKRRTTDILAGGVVKEAVESLLKEEQAKTEADEEADMMKKISFKHSIKTYKKIAYSFIALTIILLAVMAYFSLVRVTITLIPNQERVSNNLIFDVYDKDNNTTIPESAVAGVVKFVAISETKIYPATGVKVIGEDVTGKVTIVNNYNKNQPLVATTRLLTPEGKLFRIRDTVNVPAGGSVEVEVYADQPSKDTAVGPTKFTIPGLWAGLQSQIYAESKEEIKYQEQVKKHITQEDIDNAIRDIKQQLLAKAKTEINEQYKDYDQIIYKIDENSINSRVNANINEEKDEFTVDMEANVAVVAFGGDKAAKLAEQKFISTLSENKELINFDKSNITYALNSYDEKLGQANITATFEGKVGLKENSQIVEIDKILGLNSQQLNAYLSGLPDIAGFEVKYYPSFIKYVPRLVDKITIEIKK